MEHQFLYPKFVPAAMPLLKPLVTVGPLSSRVSQRELVVASLLRCPDRPAEPGSLRVRR